MAKSYTTYFNLVKFDQGDLDWDTDINSNFDTIDTEINDPESHTHIDILNLHRLNLDAAEYNFGQIIIGDVSDTQADPAALTSTDVVAANADLPYGEGERDLINEIKSDYNLLRADVTDIRTVLIGTIDYCDSLKSTINTLLSALHQGEGCGVLGSSSSSSMSSSSSSNSASTSTSSDSSSSSSNSTSTSVSV